jgi:hypothetical protein
MALNVLRYPCHAVEARAEEDAEKGRKTKWSVHAACNRAGNIACMDADMLFNEYDRVARAEVTNCVAAYVGSGDREVVKQFVKLRGYPKASEALVYKETERR